MVKEKLTKKEVEDEKIKRIAREGLNQIENIKDSQESAKKLYEELIDTKYKHRNLRKRCK